MVLKNVHFSNADGTSTLTTGTATGGNFVNQTLKEFGSKSNVEPKQIDRFSRMERMQVPAIDFYQLKVSYETHIIDEANNPAERLRSEDILAQADISLIHQQDMEGNLLASVEQESKEEIRTSFHWWLHQIVKESFGMVTVAELKKCEAELQTLCSTTTMMSLPLPIL